MSAVNPPWACQGRIDHPAQLFRMALAGLNPGMMAVGATSPGGGVNPYFGQAMQVTGLASLNVQIGTGLISIPSTTAWNGMYVGYNNATFNVVIPAVSTTQWRSDYIAAVMTDPGDNTAAWNVVDIPGAFSSSAPGALPALPANAIPLAIVRVVPNMTVTNGGGTVVDARAYSGLQGPIITTSTTRPPLTMPNGTMWYETDTQAIGVIINGAYRYLPFMNAAIDGWHTLAVGSGFSAASGEMAPRYRKLSTGLISIQGAITFPSAGSYNSVGFATLPSGYHRTDFPSRAPIAYIGANPGSYVVIVGSPRLFIDTSGGVSVAGIPSGENSQNCDISCQIDVT